MEIFDLFETSQLKEDVAHIIMHQMEELLDVSFISPQFTTAKILGQDEPHHSISENAGNHSNIALSSLAKFHASLDAYNKLKWKMYNLNEIEILKEIPFSEKNITRINSLVIEYFKSIKERYPNTFLDHIDVQDIKAKMKNISGRLNELKDCKKLLINGRYTKTNLVFSGENYDCKMIDFSYAAFQSPFFDLFQYVSSISTEKNWRIEIESAKNIYYKYLNMEMKKFDIEIETAFPQKEYEETFELLLPIMRIIFHLKPKIEKTYFELSEILSVLNLKPVGIADSVISFEDCYLVCRNLKLNQFQLNSFGTKLQESRDGFLGEHHDMTIELENEVRKNFFLKGVPRNEALREFASTLGSFFKETMFYFKYIPLLEEYGIHVLDKVVPECYFADEYKYIVLDNLKSYGFKTLSPREDMSNEIILRVLEVLAKFNASCIILEELIERKNGKKFRLPEEFARELNEVFYSLEPIVQSHKNSGKGGMTALTEILIFNDESKDSNFNFESLAELACDQQALFAQPSKKWRNTLCHGDFWTKNFMIKFDQNRIRDIMMIDFQTYRYAPPAQDLMAFIYLNTTKELRQKFINHWLDFYYKVFSEILRDYSIDCKDILPRQDFDDSCMFYKQFAITQSITHFQVILIPPHIIDPILENQNNVREIFLESRYDLVKMAWPLDELYRKRLTESVRELRECLMSEIRTN